MKTTLYYTHVKYGEQIREFPSKKDAIAYYNFQRDHGYTTYTKGVTIVPMIAWTRCGSDDWEYLPY